MALESRRLLSVSGTLDSSFGGNGVASVYFLPSGATTAQGQAAYAVAIDGGGNIVMAGYVNDAEAANGEANISATVGRLNPAGVPQPSFHGSGEGNGQVVYTSTSAMGYIGSVDEFDAIVEDDNGNILLGNGGSELMLVGQHTDAVDPSAFLNTGFSVATLPLSSGIDAANVNPYYFDRSDTSQSYDVANAALLQTVAGAPTSNTVLVAGQATASTTAVPLALVTLSGVADSPPPTGTAFGSTGTELLQIPNVIDPSVVAMAFQSGGSKILLAGDDEAGNFLVRLNTSTDEVDTTFGENGFLEIPSSLRVTSMAVNSTSNQIILAGSVLNGGTGYDFGMLAVSAAGAVNTKFGTAGTGFVTTDFDKGYDFANAVAIQSDGSIVLAGEATVSGQQIAALRYNATGILDPTFGPSTPGLSPGLVATNIDGSGSSEFYAVAIQPNDGKIVAAGTAIDRAQSESTTVVARYVGAVPGITKLSQTSATEGGASFTLTVTGSDFVSGSEGSTIDWNGAALTPTTYVNSTTLKATVPMSDIAHAGTASITISNPGNITSSAVTFAITASPAKPTITWANPAAITYGTALSSTQLDATATFSGLSVAGKFVYTPVSGTVLQGGAGQPLSVSFTPTDTTDYTTATGTVDIMVNKVTPTLVVRGASATFDGNSHPATFTITGTNGDNLTSLVALTYNGSSAIPVDAGTYAVAATFAGNGDYNAASAQATMSILAPTSAPQVTGIAIGQQSKKGISAFTVLFDESMNSGSATSIANYQVFGAVKKKKHTVYTKFVRILRISYVDSTRTATITLSKAFKGVVQVTAASGILARTASRPAVHSQRPYNRTGISPGRTQSRWTAAEIGLEPSEPGRASQRVEGGVGGDHPPDAGSLDRVADQFEGRPDQRDGPVAKLFGESRVVGRCRILPGPAGGLGVDARHVILHLPVLDARRQRELGLADRLAVSA